MAPTYKLTYFDFKGLAEIIRCLLKYGNIEFEDERIPRENWPQLKPTIPFEQLPVLTVDGKPYTQSLAIARFVAKKAKLTGKDDLEDMEIDSIVDTINDFRMKVVSWHFEADPTVKAAKKDGIMNETLPFYMDRLEKVAKENGGHLACKKLTWADFYITVLSEAISFFFGGDIFSKHPNLALVRKNVQALPAIKKWMETRPKTDF